MNFATVKGWEIPEGKSVKVTDASGRVLWSAVKPMVEVTVMSTSNYDYVYIEIDGVRYNKGTSSTMILPVGTVVRCYASHPSQPSVANITFNGEKVSSGIYDHVIRNHTRIGMAYMNAPPSTYIPSGMYIANVSITEEAKTLPVGYTQLEYIESTGTQYIDVGHKPLQYISIEMDFQLTSTADQQRLFGTFSAGTESSKELSVEVYTTDGAYKFCYQNNKPNWIATGIAVDTNRHKIKLDGYNKVFTFDDVYSASLSEYTATNTSQRNLCLLWTAYTDQDNHIKASARIYSCLIHDYGYNCRVRNFVPCRNENGVVGLYDMVSNKFYTNAGSGEFIAGPAV